MVRVGLGAAYAEAEEWREYCTHPIAGAARGPRASSPSEFAMKTLAEETGARPFFPNVITDLASVYESIATELASQYSLAYTPKAGAQNSEFRKIAVRVLARPEVRARTRSGYTPRRGARMGE